MRSITRTKERTGESVREKTTEEEYASNVSGSDLGRDAFRAILPGIRLASSGLFAHADAHIGGRGRYSGYVNGQRVGSASDASFRSGSVGMLVNLKGTEVAFSN